MNDDSNINFDLFGLLHIQAGETTAANISTKNFESQMSIYVKMAANLCCSLKSKGIKFSVLTNNKKLVDDLLGSHQDAPEVIQIEFPTNVPSGIKFYSAHFKFDAFRYLSMLNQRYVGLCDLDMVCINDPPTGLSNAIQEGIPMFYDISDQVIPAYGHDTILRDLERIHLQRSEGRWAGGEYVSGTPAFFAHLVREIDRLYPRYLAQAHELHHVGDEAVTSAALECMRRSGAYIGDAGTLGIVGRFWNWAVLHPQRPFSYFENCFLVHLPSDKDFLASRRNDGEFVPGDFIHSYRYCRLKRAGAKFVHFLVNSTIRRRVAN